MLGDLVIANQKSLQKSLQKRRRRVSTALVPPVGAPPRPWRPRRARRGSLISLPPGGGYATATGLGTLEFHGRNGTFHLQHVGNPWKIHDLFMAKVALQWLETRWKQKDIQDIQVGVNLLSQETIYGIHGLFMAVIWRKHLVGPWKTLECQWPSWW